MYEQMCFIHVYLRGYGDLTPSTYWGRGTSHRISLSTHVLPRLVFTCGRGDHDQSSALLIAVLSQKLLPSRWEKYIYNFVLNIELAKARKTHAANIISNGWKFWKLTRRDKQDTIEYVNAQRKFFGSITTMHQIKQERRKLTDSIIGPAELMITQWVTSTRNTALEEKVATMGISGVTRGVPGGAEHSHPWFEHPHREFVIKFLFDQDSQRLKREVESVQDVSQRSYVSHMPTDLHCTVCYILRCTPYDSDICHRCAATLVRYMHWN